MADPTLDPATNPYAPVDPTYADQTFDGPWPPEHWAEWLHPDAQDPTLAHLGGGGVDPLAAQMPEQAPTPTQPGMGIPAHTVDEAMALEQAPATMGGVANDIAQGVTGAPDAARRWWEGATAPDAPLPPSVDGALDYFRGAANDTGGALAQTVTGLPDLTGARQDATDATEGQRLANLDPEAYATLQAQHELARQSHATVRFMEETEKQRVQLEQNAKVRQEAAVKAQAATEQLATDAVKLANTEVDPDRWWHSRSTGQKIAGYIAAIVGGFAANNNGGRNIGLEAINREIDNDIDAQKANIANRRQGLDLRRGLIADQTGAANDAYRQVETVRIAAWENVTNQLTAEAQQYDPRGTAALKIGGYIRNVRQYQAAAIAKWHEGEVKRLEGEAKVKLEADKQAETKRDNIARVNAQNYGTSVQDKHNRATETIDAGKLVNETAKGQAEIGKLNAEADKLRAAGDIEGADKLQKFGVAGLYEDVEVVDPKTGSKSIVQKPFLAQAEPGEADKIRNRKTATERLVDIMDQALAKRTGWTSDTGNSKEHAEINALWSSATIEMKNMAELGQITPGDAKLIDGLLGSSDPTRWKDPQAGIKQARKNVLDHFRADLKNHGYKNWKTYDVHDVSADPKPEKTPADEALDLALSDPKTLPVTDAEMAEMATAQGYQLTGDESKDHSFYMHNMQPILNGADNVIPSQRKAVDRFARMANSKDDTERRAGFAGLAKLRSESASDGVRRLAEQAENSTGFAGGEPEQVK